MAQRHRIWEEVFKLVCSFSRPLYKFLAVLVVETDRKKAPIFSWSCSLLES